MDPFTFPIIRSILDTDLYKLTMQQAVFHQYPKTRVKYLFTCRNQDQKLGYLADIVRAQIDMMANLKLEPEEKAYLETIRFLKGDYIEALANFRFDPTTVLVFEDGEGYLHIEMSGSWFDTILWEVPILAIVSEANFRSQCTEDEIERNYEIGRKKLVEKANLVNKYHFSLVDMGTRRRASFVWQNEVIGYMAKHCARNDFRGTSNVYLAMKYGLKAFGTQAHEWHMAHLSLVDDIRQAEGRALHVWQQEYDDNLGYALPDTFSTAVFFQDFDRTLTRSYDGVRHDSGDPRTFADKIIEHYQKMGIDPLTKYIVFSDNLKITEEIIVPLYLEYVSKIRVSFGVGTNLTNDLDFKALNIVIKMSECQGKPVIKLSDAPGKVMGDPNTIAAIKVAYHLD